MEFIKVCPKCLKTYVNGAIGTCGKCKVSLKSISLKDKYVKDGALFLEYKIDEGKK